MLINKFHWVLLLTLLSLISCSDEENVDCNVATKEVQTKFDAWVNLAEPEVDLLDGIDDADCNAYKNWLTDYEKAFDQYSASFRKAKSCTLIKTLLSSNGYKEGEVDKYLADEKENFDFNYDFIYSELKASCN
jgi:hypothetical protein